MADVAVAAKAITTTLAAVGFGLSLSSLAVVETASANNNPNQRLAVIKLYCSPFGHFYVLTNINLIFNIYIIVNTFIKCFTA